MKIAILTSGILPVPAVQGGAVENLIDFYLEYNDRHRLHDITVYSVWHRDVEQHPALQSSVNHYKYIKVDSLWGKLKKRFYHLTHKECYYHYHIEYFLHEAIKHIRRTAYDVIIIENRPGFALLLKGNTNAKLVYHLHNKKLTFEHHQCRAIYDAAYRIITVSDFIKSSVVSINPHDQKTQTVYNGIDLKAFSVSDIPIDRKAIGLADDDFVLLFSGRVNEEKGILQLVEAMNTLRDYPHIKLLVIGSSFYGNADNENPFAQALQKKAASLGGRIQFTGFIPYEQMPSYLAVADVAVIPSVWDDPFPTTVLEAQAMGLPVISTYRGGIPEEVTEETAILLQTDNQFVSHLSNAILDLYQHPEKCEAMGKAAKKHSLLFSKEHYARNFFEALSLH